jgi:hypothetical protein
MNRESSPMRRWAMSTPPSVWLSLVIILIALAGGYLTIKATSTTSGSAEAIATVVAAVVGVAGTHIGHVIGHSLGKGEAAEVGADPEGSQVHRMGAGSEGSGSEQRPTP